MSKSNRQRQKEYRERKQKELGADEYRRINREKAKARRTKSKTNNIQNPLVSSVLQAIKDLNIRSTTPELKKQDVDKIMVKISPDILKHNNISYIESFIGKLKNIDDKAKPRTIKSYFSKLKTLYNRYTGKVWVVGEFEWLRETKNILDFIATHNKWNSVSKWNYVSAICGITSRLAGWDSETDIYNLQSKAGFKKYLESRENNILSDKQRKNILSWDKILSLAEPEDIELKVLFGLLKFRPRRSGTYRILKILDSHNTTDNYIYIEDGKPESLVLQTYKTSHIYGRYEEKLPPTLADLISEFVTTDNMVIGDYLFVKNNGDPMSQSYFSSFITDTISKLTKNKKMGTTLLRISYASHIVKNTKTIAERKIFALGIGHSHQQMMLYAKSDL